MFKCISILLYLSDVGALSAHIWSGDDDAPFTALTHVRIVGHELRGFSDENLDDGMATFFDLQSPLVINYLRSTVVLIFRYVRET